MARYEPRFKPSVARDLRGLPRADVRRILARVDTLRDNPRPPGAEKLSAQERYRLRQGNYRILYTVADAELVVEVVKVAHRRDVYRTPS
jgi:mRNA interferase RelE/StbE